jgi:hypothetical protein
MTRPRRFRPTVEPLGPKVLPSSSALRLLGPLGALIEDATADDPLSISGKLRGTATARPGSSDPGAALDLSGAGRVDSLGPVQFAGALEGVGRIRRGRAVGSLTLSAERGSITLRLLGPAQGRRARLPDRFRFVVQDQTGATRPLKGNRGTVRVDTGPEPGAIGLVLRSADEGS